MAPSRSPCWGSGTTGPGPRPARVPDGAHASDGPGAGAALPDDSPSDDVVRIDPLGVLAQAAGYDDPERWWEDAVEHRTSAGSPAGSGDRGGGTPAPFA